LYQIQVILAREHEIAKAHLAAGRKDRALVALRQRKYQQSLLSKTDSQLETLEQLVGFHGHYFCIFDILLSGEVLGIDNRIRLSRNFRFARFEARE